MTENLIAATPAAETHEAGHRSAVKREEHFRWRGGEITRLEAFCDVVFGFAITLLVVSLEVPHTYAELMADMRGFLPFAACFAQLAIIWRAHYRFSRRFGLEDPYTIFLNVVLLFLVLFYVYPLKFVFTLVFSQITGSPGPAAFDFHEGSVVMRIYAAGFASVFLLFALLYTHAYRLRCDLDLNPVETLETRFSIQENVLLGLIGIASFLVAIKSPGLAGWIYLSIGPLLWLHGSISGKQVRKQAEKMRSEL
jgi:uncharacterized membrane protein